MELKEYLDSLVEQYQVSAFIEDDPVQFVHMFEDRRDIEIVALIVSTIAWGRRPMILRNAMRIIDMMHRRPLWYVLHGDFDEIDPDVNLHRTFFGRHLLYYLRGLRALYGQFGGLEEFAAAQDAARSDAPAWVIASALSDYLRAANLADRCLPSQVDKSALKRFNMALRWLVRPATTGIDTGVWTLLRPDQLFIPLDTHVAANARALGLMTRRQNDRRAVEELTASLRAMRPDDPVAYDFALFAVTAGGEKIGPPTEH